MEHIYTNKNVIVLGLSKTGFSTALYLLNQGANVTVSTLENDIDEDNLNYLMSRGVKVIFGPHPLDIITHQIHYIIKNPGIPYHISFLQKAEQFNIPILTEIELVSAELNDIIAITGSNGKTTTTSLVHAVLSKEKESIVCGNIGRPLTDVFLKNEQNKLLISELSSFQLKGTTSFRPKIAILLNIDSAHLDYHKTIEDYIDSKAQITVNQTDEDFFIYNAESAILHEIAKSTSAKTIPFSTEKFLSEGASTQDGKIYYQGKFFMQTSEVSLPGNHNLENILAALIVGKLHDIPDESIREVLSSFEGVKHRLQFVKSIDGVKFYNDSKATNVKASSNAIKSFDSPPILIAGGLDRGDTFENFVPFLGKCKNVVVYGQSAQKIKDVAEHNSLHNVSISENLENAVKSAYELSSAGDVILLSPACASWDQFKNFEERGNLFIDCVNQLK